MGKLCIQMKKDYDVFTMIKKNSGFGWHIEKEVLTAPDGVWDTYIKVHLEADKFRYRGLLYYVILDQLCMNMSAMGEEEKSEKDEELSGLLGEGWRSKCRLEGVGGFTRESFEMTVGGMEGKEGHRS
ncbi:hypothetical protein L873DRAFT_1788230 [Choiromyces venosus 120613-1]|uniref:Myb/SANT-like domain-containing protein n=1 Tax=Choiromyces venosus 120613-1 TaxID=1336337 RepID=A0A3N4JTQ4_9PEZI|nr:hypothetical protein L873DRAFT_1788230 [Choiromyces venosus 120613-1]